MQFVPEKLDEFRSHKHFTLLSLLKRYQDFRPGTQPYKDYKFKNEPIYLKKDVIHLHTAEQWKRLGRLVKKRSKPIKTVKGRYNDKEKSARLFACWQTEPFINSLNPDGSLPENEYGNIEVLNGQVPRGTMYLDLYRVKKICKELDVPYKEALIGFTVAANGNSYPIKKGVVVHDYNVEKIMAKHKIELAAKEKRDTKRNKAEAKKVWKMLIRRVVAKRYVSILFDRSEQEQVDIVESKTE